ncbi:MAG: hypothetical protein NC300_11140 [Bacteroidales bacterium]|nr:hypothetical protein [Clostridium sp.]MCM1204685.1 hypothetical protein [Bacteroidales bacterium]
MKEGDILSKTFLWIEDRKGKSGYIFWKVLMQYLFPDITVESKTNNSELVKAVKSLPDEKNKYIIVLDNSFDNLQVYQEQKQLNHYAKEKNNVSIMNIICFEYILLEFDKLIDWIYASNDEFLTKRAGAIAARAKLVATICSGEFNYKTMQEIIKYDDNLDNHNVEQLSAKLLFDLTRNTGFEVSKGNIGECWIKSCCEWSNRQDNDICGLDENRLSVTEKMKHIFNGTSLHSEFSNLGLGVLG